MKRVFFCLLDLISVAFLVGAYMINYYTRSKLGMVRWSNFNAHKLLERMPFETIKTIVLVLILFCAVLIFRKMWLRRAAGDRFDMVMMWVMAVLCAACVWAVLTFRQGTCASWFLIIPAVYGSCLFVMLRNLFALLLKKG